MSIDTHVPVVRVARNPEDLSELFVARVNAGDLDGLVELYEPDAVLATPYGDPLVGHAQIRAFYATLLQSRPTVVNGRQHPALRTGDLALTSTMMADGHGATAEVARRQPDGSWRWVLDRSNVLA